MKKVLLTLSSMILLIGALLFLLYPKNKYKETINYEVTEEIIEEIKEDKEDEYITEIHIVKMKIKLDLIQDSCCFGFQDCTDGIIALAWENMDGYDEYPEEGRIFFRFGETLNEVESKLAVKNILMLN